MLLVFNRIVTFFSPQITIFIFYSWKQRYRLSGILRIKNHFWLCNIVTQYELLFNFFLGCWSYTHKHLAPLVLIINIILGEKEIRM